MRNLARFSFAILYLREQGERASGLKGCTGIPKWEQFETTILNLAGLNSFETGKTYNNIKVTYQPAETPALIIHRTK